MSAPCHVPLPMSVIVVEPFCGGSHAQAIAFLQRHVLVGDSREGGTRRLSVHTLPAKKWHWRMRCAAAWAAADIPVLEPCAAHASVLFVSSMLNLCELLGMRPDLVRLHPPCPPCCAREPRAHAHALHSLRTVQYPCKKIVYFHENQLAYPSRRGATHESKSLLEHVSTPTSARDGATEVGTPLQQRTAGAGTSMSEVAGEHGSSAFDAARDFQFGWAQLMSAKVADVCVFNSHFNMETFLECAAPFLNVIPDKLLRCAGLVEALRAKSHVIYFPVEPPPPFALETPPPCSTEGGEIAATSGNTFVPVPPLVIGWNHRWEHDK
ncbi:DUF3524 domain-containing protein, partial [archaeon]